MNNYLTEENVRKLREELDYRMSVVRAKIDEDVVTLVTTMDLDLENMCISIESDLGKALMGKKVGDVVEVEAPGGNYTVEVLEIL